jgi:hypothetical protein
MRIQYAVICHDFQDGPWDGATNILGVRHKLFVPCKIGGTSAPGQRRAAVPLKLVVSLIEGAPGQHHIWVSVRGPGQPAPKTLPPLLVEWDDWSPTFFAIIDIYLEVFDDGMYEFSLLVDGEPLGSVPLPVEVVPTPG